MQYIFLLLAIILTTCSGEAGKDDGVQSFVCFGDNIFFSVYQNEENDGQFGYLEYGIFFKKPKKNYEKLKNCEDVVCSVEKLPPYKKYSLIAKRKDSLTGEYYDNDKKVEFETYLDFLEKYHIYSNISYILSGNYIYSKSKGEIFLYQIFDTGIEKSRKFNLHKFNSRDFSNISSSEIINLIESLIKIEGLFIEDVILVNNYVYISEYSSDILTIFEISSDTGSILNKNTISLSGLSLVPQKLLFFRSKLFFIFMQLQQTGIR